MPTISLAQLQTLTYDRLEQNSALYTATQVTATLNEAYRLTNIFAGINQALVSVPGFSVAGQYLYAVPAPVLVPLEAYFEGRQLRHLSMGALARNYRGWATDASSKSGPPQRWAPLGITLFVLNPADSIGGRDIAVQGIIEPTLLALPADTISVEDEYVDMIVSYAAHRLQMKESGKDFADSSMYIQEYYSKLKGRRRITGSRSPRLWVQTGPVV